MPRYEPGFENRCGRCGSEPATADFYLRDRRSEPEVPELDELELVALCEQCFTEWQAWFNSGAGETVR
jgi:hypothetical protein